MTEVYSPGPGKPDPGKTNASAKMSIAEAISWSVCGLQKPYYFKQVVIGILLYVAIFGWLGVRSDLTNWQLCIAASNILMYPYSMFVYDAVCEWMFGHDRHFMMRSSLILVLLRVAFKLTVLVTFFLFAPVIGIVGLVWLLVMHAMEDREFGKTF